MKRKSKSSSVYEILRYSEEPIYPELLTKLISGDHFPHEMEKAEYLLNIWVETFKGMSQIERSKYHSVLPQILKNMLTIFMTKNRCALAIVYMYSFQYMKWTELVRTLKKGLKENKASCLTLLWKICYLMIEPVHESEKFKLGIHLSEEYEEALSKYRWKNHK
jgi:hypothetical protein